MTNKFVDAESEAEALDLAIERTTLLMLERGFEEEAIPAFQFTLEEIEEFDRYKEWHELDRTLFFYSDG